MQPSRRDPRSLALLTDLYQLTMAYGYWRAEKQGDEAVFHLFYRENPFDGGYAIAAGLEHAIEYIENLRFSADDLEYLRSLRGNDGARLFPDEFVEYLRTFEFTCDIDAVPEGTVVFPHEPLLRVRGPILQAQFVETALLNLINFQTLIATKAARVVLAAKGDPVLDFGLRRAQGIDGALAASRAAYLGGCAATSNVLAGAMYGIPVRGTHAHSWVMSFPTELEAFQTYAEVMPNNALLLVDTYNTLDGVAHAIETGKRLRANGHELAGIRLDSGDLAYLSIEARRMLDEAGFPNVRISASNDLDEHLIASLKEQGARIDVWGVGTKLITAFDQPALGGVYKLTAIRGSGQPWQYKIKLSEQAIKISNPGILQVRRFVAAGEAAGDMIFSEDAQEPTSTIVDPLDPTRRKRFDESCDSVDLLVPVFRRGVRVYDPPPLPEIRTRREQQLALFHPGVKRLVNPHRYPVGLEQQLFELKTRLILEARGVTA
ncbi:MAG TPA: nicotinate phosphoribosyltransferase [Thermoanaerobaculia bacterium]|nr:nicotinate phosphoribosyltransferase [Thermoanaerobaculia bacterium]